MSSVVAADTWPSMADTIFSIGKKTEDGKLYVYLDYEPWPDAHGIRYRKPATYLEISEWVSREYGLAVTGHHIAQVKRKHGIVIRRNQSEPARQEDTRIPPDREAAIEAALRHFGMIPDEN